MNITNFCVNNKCSRCGGCCSDFLFISKAEINNIFQYLIAHPEIEEQNGKALPNGKVPCLCPFYSASEKKCLIYKVRPKVCKRFKCNMCESLITSMKAEFIKDPKYFNTSEDNLVSMHDVFFNNKIVLHAFLDDMKKIRSLDFK